MLTYIESTTNKEVTITHKHSGSVTIYMKETIVAQQHGCDVQALVKWAEDYIYNELDCILSREDFYTISYSLAFGMHPEHQYTS